MTFHLDATEKHYAPHEARPGLRGILIPGRRGKRGGGSFYFKSPSSCLRDNPRVSISSPCRS